MRGRAVSFKRKARQIFVSESEVFVDHLEIMLAGDVRRVADPLTNVLRK